MANIKNLKPFKKGYDPRRWLGGRGKKSPEQREGEKILRAVIWEELSREFNAATMKPLDTPEVVDALRLSIRSLLKRRPELLFDRIAGKVTERVDITSDGKNITEIGVRFIDYRDGIAPTEERPGGDNKTSGEN